MSNTKILYYAREFYADYGARTHAREFYSHLKKIKGKENVFLYPPTQKVESLKVTRRMGIFKKIIPQKFILTLQLFIYNKKELKNLEKFIEDNCIDTVIIRAGYKIAFTEKIRKIKSIKRLIIEVNASILDEQLKGAFLTPLLRKREIDCYKNADFISVVSPLLLKKFSKEGLNENKIIVNPNGVNKDFFKPDQKCVEHLKSKYNINNNAIKLGYIGGFESFKKIPQVVKEFISSDLENDITLILIGTGEDLDKIKNLIKTKPTEPNRKIILIDNWVPHNELPNYLALFDINIFPYTADHVSPLKIFEYLATGKPTIAPEIPSLQELFTSNKELVFVSQKDHDFIKVLKSLLRNKHIKEIGLNGKQKVLKDYSWEENVNRILNNLKA